MESDDQMFASKTRVIGRQKSRERERNDRGTDANLHAMPWRKGRRSGFDLLFADAVAKKKRGFFFKCKRKQEAFKPQATDPLPFPEKASRVTSCRALRATDEQECALGSSDIALTCQMKRKRDSL